jgi:hypothetical protein
VPHKNFESKLLKRVTYNCNKVNFEGKLSYLKTILNYKISTVQVPFSHQDGFSYDQDGLKE